MLSCVDLGASRAQLCIRKNKTQKQKRDRRHVLQLLKKKHTSVLKGRVMVSEKDIV